VLGFALTGGLLYQQAKNSRKQMAATQFKDAIQHLGDEKQAIVLGGVHALHKLATTFPKEYSKQVFDVLCNFIRVETTRKEYKDIVEKAIEERHKHPIRIQGAIESVGEDQLLFAHTMVIQTIVNILFRDKESRVFYKDYPVNLSGAFLCSVDLRGANLRRASLWYVDLRDADFSEANLQGANLMGANLQKTSAMKADLRGACLYQAKLQLSIWLGGTKKFKLFEKANFCGVWSKNENFSIIENAKQGKHFETDLSGITFIDPIGKEFKPEDRMLECRESDVNVKPPLTAEEVQELFKDWFNDEK